MSYRDLRNFTEMMRALGFTRLISMENFRTPNFHLVADILIWLVKRFEPEADIHEQYNSEQDRVLLVRTAAECMAVKAAIILNTKRIYQADGFAVKELLKITRLLYNAQEANMTSRKESLSWSAADMVDLTSHVWTYHCPSIQAQALYVTSPALMIEDLKSSRELASQLTSKGALIYELLGKDMGLNEERLQGVNNMLEMSKVDKALKEAVASVRENILNTKSLIENVSTTESSLDSKIEKKQMDLERNRKRLQTLKKVRPAFLEEFEKLEVELQGLYTEYIDRARCLAHLEQALEEAAVAEQDRMQRRQRETRKLMEELQLEDARKMMEDEEGLDPTIPEEKPAKPVGRLRTATASKVRLATGRKRVYGGMAADDDSNSLDSDSELLLDVDVDDDSDLLGSGDDLKGIASESKSDQSDDDF